MYKYMIYVNNVHITFEYIVIYIIALNSLQYVFIFNIQAYM